MALTKTLNFLPSVFQTETNDKFLSVTLDQLVTEPNLVPINGYVGRKFTPGWDGIESYVREPSNVRADYQLEPTTVVKNQTDNTVEFYNTYPELLQKIQYFGGNVVNQDRLFTSEYYTYEPKINYDAFVNYSQYYWLPSGPDPVNITTSEIATNQTFYVYPDNNTNVYNLSGFGAAGNPDIILVREGTYQFVVNQPGKRFYIQTEPGLSGRQTNNNNLSSREIYGVTNNGDDVGTITFVVPESTVQDNFLNADNVADVGFVTTLKYSQIDQQLLSTVAELGGLDGITASTLIDGKSLIFGVYYTDSADWDSGSGPVSAGLRYGVWDISLTPSGGDYLISLTAGTSIPTGKKVTVLTGQNYGNTEWYKNATGYLSQVPVITAPFDTLYYQDSEDASQYGKIQILSSTTKTIDVDVDIIGKVNYVSPNKVTFTNGLKIKFDNTVTPETYRNNEYYVQGVGTSISLTPVEWLSVFYPINGENFSPVVRFLGATTFANLNQSKNQIRINSNADPFSTNISTDYVSSGINSNNIFSQSLTYTYPYRGGFNEAGDNTSNLLRTGTIAVSLVGIPIYGPTNEWYIEGRNATVWNYNAPFVKINGQDSYGGYPDNSGIYHYQDSTFITANAWGNVSGLSSNLWVESDGHSTLIGYAADGYPIYGPFGYNNPLDAASGATRMTSSYSATSGGLYRPANQAITVTANNTSGSNLSVSSTFGLEPGMKLTFSSNASILTPDEYWIVASGGSSATGPQDYGGGSNQIQLNKELVVYANTSLQFEFVAGSFIEDFVFQEGLGSLDRFNGRYCVTPEYPNGTYAYFATQDSSGNPVYPYFIGQNFYGSLDITGLNQLTDPDYITIDRSSRDLNPWSRRNRWFHKEVLAATANYNGTSFSLESYTRAQRPIIEFIPNLQLYNFGNLGLIPVDIFDTTITQPFSTVEGVTGIFLDGVRITDGMRIIFANDRDPLTRNRIYVASFVDVDGIPETAPTLTLKLIVAYDGIPDQGETVSVLNGVSNIGKSFWFNGDQWIEGQTKSGLNVPPLFDVFDADGNSFSDTDFYPVVNNQLAFSGSKVFSYLEGTGTDDAVLGFPLSYRTLDNQGDIQFVNNFDVDTFNYSLDGGTEITAKVNSGYLHRNNSDGSLTKLTVWNTVLENTKQYQIISYEYDGLNNDFRIDVEPVPNTGISNLEVYLNFIRLNTVDYQIAVIPNNTRIISITPTLIKPGDKIDIRVYSNQQSKLGSYEVPRNLNYNAQNEVLSYPTLGQLRNHIGAITRSSSQFVGAFPGTSNLQDINLTNYPGLILQQSSPVTYASMFLTDKNLDFVSSVINAQQEYTRFKNKFLTLSASTNQVDTADPISGVNYILKEINKSKNSTFPWYYSDMIPYGDDVNVITYTILDPLQTNYEITTTFSLTSLSNQSILVYLNGTQLLNGYDYTFLSTGPGIVLSDDLARSVNDVLKIYEYANTDGNYIPETPTKLGLYPKYKPELVADTTYVTPIYVIVGHDGSRTPAFGDFRDNYLLELEKRIYNNIKSQYNEDQISVYNSKPGKFRANDYNLETYNRIVSQSFLLWAGQNKVDYTTNNTYNGENTFTFNYSSAKYTDGSFLPGSWRSCFEYFYDTQRPNTHPWEMLGFSERPDWWVSTYGPAPYTAGNTILWTDLKNGYIAGGSRQGYDTKFARSNLLNILPVDENGNVRSPLEILTSNYNFSDFEKNWSVGQWGPAESAWRNSSEWPYAQQIVMALTKPANYFALAAAIDKYNYNQVTNQYTVDSTNYRLTPSDITVNGDETLSGTILRNAGYVNWINDYQISKGVLSNSKLKRYLEDYSIQLSYRMAGYSDKKLLKVLADQNSPSSVNSSVIIPDEDYDLILGRSTPLAKIKYSGVIVKKVSSGFEISGYDRSNPVFNIVAPDVNNTLDTLTVLDESVSWYTEFRRYRLSIPYGTVLDTLQDVANFLAGYERFLLLQGFRFDYFDDRLGQIRNWQLSIKEIMFWSQQNWPVNSVIVVSPFAERVKVITNNSFVEGIENSYFGTKVMDQNFAILGNDDYTVKRSNSEFNLVIDSLNGQNFKLVGYLELNLIQIENVLIFNNETQFNDIIYDPQSGERQYRLRLVGQKTADWTGSLYAPGYIYNEGVVPEWEPSKDYLKGDLVLFKTFYYAAKNNVPGTEEFNFTDWKPVDRDTIKTGLLKNFSYNAGQLAEFYDINKVNIESEEDQLGFGLIGFRSREYLSDFGINDTSQLKLYQGFIKQKGTKNAIDALAKVSIDPFTPTVGVDVKEQWAFRVGSYGALDTNQYVELVLDESYFLNNPTSLTINANDSVTLSSVYTRPDILYKSSEIPFSTPFFLTRTNNSVQTDDILTAGFPNIEDVDYTVFDLNNLSTLNQDLNTIGTGQKIWCAIDFNKTWNVFYVTGLRTDVLEIRNALNGRLNFRTSNFHNLSKNDVIILQNAEDFSGFYKIDTVDSLTSFTVTTNLDLTGFSSLALSAPIYKLQSLKFDYASQITTFTPLDGWSANDKAWITANTVNGEWAVYNKTEPWAPNVQLPQSQYYSNGGFGTSLKISSDNNFVLVGQPGFNSNIGSVVNYKRTSTQDLVEDRTVTGTALNLSAYGYSIDSKNNIIAVGAPESGTNGEGYVYIYQRDFQGLLSKVQIISASNSSARDFGRSVSMSDDNQWLYVGAPESDQVVVYAWDASLEENVDTLTVPNANVATFTLTFDPIAAETITVSNSSVEFVPYRDYTVTRSPNTIVFATNAQPDTYVIRAEGPAFVELTELLGTANTNFGFSVASSTEGAQVVIGSPTANVTVGNTSLQSAGTISVYDRSIEKFIAIDGQTLFGGYRTPSSFSKVYVNTELQVEGIDYSTVFTNWIQFTVAPGAGKIITIETDEFNLIETTAAVTPIAETQFGYSVDLCPYNCSIYSGAPYYSSNESLGKFKTGAVYRHVNQARVYGNITGNIQNPTVTSADSIRLNDFEIFFLATGLDDVVSEINDAGVPGVTAANVDGYLSLTSDSTVVADRLRVLPGVGTALQDLGLDVFKQTEIILNPTNFAYDQFGQKVQIDATSERLVVGSTEAITVVDTTFDLATFETTFDADGTRFKDEVDAGAVWIFNYLSDSRNNINNAGAFAYVQQLTPSNVIAPGFNITVGMKFGSAFDLQNQRIFVGASNESTRQSGAGSVVLFNNADNLKGWDVFRYQQDKVNINSIIKSFIYSAENQLIINNLDYIDPAKGKILGAAEQDITYKVDYDPAVYNNGSLDTISLDPEFTWNDQNVGQVWWDLSTVRFLDYEQGSVLYRTTNWGRVFPGSSIDVYEWIESNYPPSRYVETGGDGEPKYPDNSAYVTISYVDPQSNTPLVKYYYWVKNKTNVTANQFGRTIPTTTIADYIRNPRGSNISYFAAIRPDSVAIYNVLDNLIGTDTIFHVSYASQINSNIIHSEYALLAENETRPDLIPTGIYNKLVDSLSGVDLFGNPVPDPSLGVQERYGIEIRPRQSVFQERDGAVRSFVNFANSIFAKYTIAEGFDLTLLNGSVTEPGGAGEQIPVANSGAWDLQVNTYEELTYINIIIQPVGYKVLVTNDSTVGNLWTIYTKQSDDTWLLTRVQSYRVTDYWQYTDWYAEGFNSKTVPTYTINTFADLATLTQLRTQDTVKVLNNGQNKWVLLQVYPNVVNTVGLENGTIEFLPSLYDLPTYGMGYDNDLFDSARFDQNPSLEIRQLITAVKQNIFIKDLSSDFTELFFILVYYALQEQKSIDWAFKTSLVDIVQKIDGLNQPQIYYKDNQDFYLNYIDEVKPYHTTLKEFIVDYLGKDNWTGYTTDFDLPAYFDTVNQQYRSPGQTLAQDVDALTNLVQYRDWNLSYTYYVDDITVANGGSGYTSAPNVTVTGSAIGNDAVARALITNGVVTRIEVQYPGSNYITQANVTLSGGSGSGATAYAVLKNDVTRKLKTTIAYDRVTYGSTVLTWTANTSYSIGDIVTYSNVAYEVVSDFTSGSTFSGTNLERYAASKFRTANDRIESFYYPEQGQSGKDFGLLQTGIDYPGVGVEGPLFTDAGGFDIGNFDIAPFDALEIDEDGTYIISETILDTRIQSDYTDTSLGIRPEDILVDGGPYISEQVLDWQANTYFPQGTVIKNNGAYYIGNVGITTGSTFSTANLSIYPLDPYSAFGPHAPEELLPGRVYDTVDMTVYTLYVDPCSTDYQDWVNLSAYSVANITVVNGGLGYDSNVANITVTVDGGGGATASVSSVDANGSITSISIISSGSTYTTVPNVVITGSNTSPATAFARLTQSDYGTFEFRIFKDMNDNWKYYRLDSDATVTLTNALTITSNTITVSDSSKLANPAPYGANPGVIIVNGERITYYQKDDATNTLSQIRRGTWGTGANTHANGSTVIDASIRQQVPYSEHTFANGLSGTVFTTAGIGYTYDPALTYMQSTLIYDRGLAAVEIQTEETIANVDADLIFTEDGGAFSNIAITTEPSTPSAADPCGMFVGDNAQTIFIKQGAA